MEKQSLSYETGTWTLCSDTAVGSGSPELIEAGFLRSNGWVDREIPKSDEG